MHPHRKIDIHPIYFLAMWWRYTPHCIYDKYWARSLKDLYMNFPTHVSICWSLLHMRKINFSSSVIRMKFGAMCVSFENKFSLSAWLILHSMRKCLSSSRTWQEEHLRSSIFVLGRVYLPYSIARVCELVLRKKFMKRHLKMSFAKWRLFCLWLNV